MRKEIRRVDEGRGIMQITLIDERWYSREALDPATGLPKMEFRPSSTWIASCYPKGIGYYRWLAENGWDESQALMREAGEKGSKVHAAISAIIEGQEVRIDSKFVNPNTEKEEELTLAEIDCIKSFVDWKASKKEIVPIAWDKTLWSDQHNVAGSLDLLALIDGRLTLVDFKTSQYVWPSHEIQMNIYKKLLENGENPITHKGRLLDTSSIDMLLLQVGYLKNRNRYKENVIRPDFELVTYAQGIWRKETEGKAAGEVPYTRDYPIVLSPGLKVEDAVAEPGEETVLVYEGSKMTTTISLPRVAKPLPQKKGRAGSR